MSQSILLNNPYEKVYRDAEIKIHQDITKCQAQNLVRHIGLVYNTFGIMMKDLIKVVSYKFAPSQADNSQTNIFAKGKDKQVNDVFTQQKKEVQIRPLQNRQSMEIETKKTAKQNKIVNKEKSKVNEPPRKDYNYDKEFQREIEAYRYNKQSVRSKRSQNSQGRDSDSRVYTDLLKDKKESKRSQNVSKFKQNSVIVIEEEQNFNINVIPNPNNQPSVPKRFHGRQSEYFAPIPNDNSNSSVRILPGRTKKEREQFPGIACVDCQKYYKSVGMDAPKICQCTSRHKASIPMNRQKFNFTQQFDLD